MGRDSGHTRGFTLTEMLAALLVLALFGALVTTGVNLAVSVKEESKFISDSDVLASTINTALADCIHYKDTVDNQEGVLLHGKNITNDPSAPNLPVLKVDATTGHFLVAGYYNGIYIEERLLNDGAYGDLTVSVVGTPDFSSDAKIEYTIIGNTNKPNQTKKVEVSYAKLSTSG